jgi:hypothetical protein
MGATATSTLIQFNQQDFEYIGDLKWFEGALISLFREKSGGGLYVLHWVDLVDNYHRWLFFPISPRSLRLYLEQKLSNEDLFALSGQEDVWVLDMNADMEFEIGKIEKLPIASLPTSYLPSPKGFFKASLSPDLIEIQAILQTYPTEKRPMVAAATLPAA